jgi:hypothetical protein
VMRGTLVCRGTAERPVLFTSSKDVPKSATAAKPFDWNGIKVTAEATGITLEQCTVAYSTFGLDIESNATPVAITNVSFHDNGSASLMRGKTMMPVNESMPLSFNWPENVTPRTGKSPAIKNEKKSTRKESAGPNPAWKKTVRIAAAGSAIVGSALWLTGYLRAEHYNSLIKPGTPNAKVKEYKNSWDSSVSVRNVGIGLFCLGAAGFAVTFVF